ncbi:MAG: TOPRIM nucleotidyl transferase/hydrolase domain-containing protein, partial [Umezawaea sp.]
HVNVVVATHSLNLVDGVDISDVVLLTLDERRRTRVERLGARTGTPIERHLGAVAASVGLRNSVLLHERCFLAVEGDAEQQAIPILFALSEGLPLQASGIALWSVGGNTGALHLAAHLHRRGRAVTLLLGAGGEDRLAVDKAFGPDCDAVVTVLATRFEGLFDEVTWANTANAAWPRIDRPWSPQDFAPLPGAVGALLREHSQDPPANRAEMIMDLVLRLERPVDVPRELRDVFAALRTCAQ